MTELEDIKKDIEAIKDSIDAIKGAIICLSRGPYMKDSDLQGFINNINQKEE